MVRPGLSRENDVCFRSYEDGFHWTTSPDARTGPLMAFTTCKVLKQVRRRERLPRAVCLFHSVRTVTVVKERREVALKREKRQFISVCALCWDEATRVSRTVVALLVLLFDLHLHQVVSCGPQQSEVKARTAQPCTTCSQ
ncbi:hypothetical protein AOLI_G00296970 [Acnodon oligacanthus]